MIFHPADVAHAALIEAGRPDLADRVAWVEEGRDSYLEVDGYISSDADCTLIDQVENIARASIGLPPIDWSRA
jgi:hypothetical protein